MKFKNLFSVLSIAVITGFVWGTIISLPPIMANRYIQYGMFRLIGVALKENLNITVIFLLFSFLILYFVWFLVTEKIRAAKNNVISFVITLGVLLFSWWCFETFTEDTLQGKLREFFIETKGIFAGKVSFSYLLNLLKTHPVAIMILISWFVGAPVLFCLLSKLKWDKISNLIKGKCIRTAGLIMVVLLLVLNIAIIIDGKISPAGPNVILLIVDAWRADSLGCYNKDSDATPNIDKFSKTAVLFKNPVAQSPNTFNSAPSIFASVYPSEHKYSNYQCRVSNKFNTIAEFLKNRKYKTFGISTNPHVSKRNGLAQGFDIFVEDTIWKDTDCDEVNERFIEWLEDNKHKKFFAMLWYIDPHSPYEPPSEYIDKYIVIDEERKNITKKAKRKAGRRKGPITEIEKEVARKLYKGEVNFFDTEFAKLINYLECNGLTENSIIILTADHGESFWEKIFLGQQIQGHGGSLYEEEIKIPLIISPPGQKEGKVVAEKVQHNDILPTILEYTNPNNNVKNIPFLRGIGMRVLIEGKKLKRKYFFSQLLDDRKNCPHYRMECIQTDDFKLIKTFEFRGKAYTPPDFQLFNLKSNELKCDIKNENFKSVFDELKTRLLSWHDNIKDTKPRTDKSYPSSNSKKTQYKNNVQDERLKERLKSLGYVQ